MNKGKTIFGILLGAVALAGGYYLYRRLKRSKDKAQDMSGVPTTTTISNIFTGTTTTTNTGTRNDSFPLAKGSRGDLVKELQKALMILYPNSLPKFGADGIWGNETEAALKNNNQPTVINKPDFDRLVAASRVGKPLTTTSGRGVFPE